MEIRIAENVRAFRKERRMTQEQLAEALGVTIGAVSKWESGSSTPDISLIVAMADFFETSVDVLLGYEWKSGGMGQAIERIRALRNRKQFDAAIAEAEQALQKYPNSFDVAFQSAILFSLEGIERKNQKSFRRSLALFERSLDLIKQNTNEQISEWTIKNRIASLYLCLGQTDEALSLMKKNNAGGLNNDMIGFTLANEGKKPDEALPYLSDAMIANVTRLFRVTNGYMNAYAGKKEYAAARDVGQWMYGVITGLVLPGKPTYMNKERAQLQGACAQMSAYLGEMDRAREALISAREIAEQFDAAPDFGYKNTRFYHGDGNLTTFDDFGDTAVEGVERMLKEEEAVAEPLLRLWAETRRTQE